MDTSSSSTDKVCIQVLGSRSVRAKEVKSKSPDRRRTPSYNIPDSIFHRNATSAAVCSNNRLVISLLASNHVTHVFESLFLLGTSLCFEQVLLESNIRHVGVRISNLPHRRILGSDLTLYRLHLDGIITNHRSQRVDGFMKTALMIYTEEKTLPS